MAPAIATGCSIIIKPASATPLTAVNLGLLLREAGLPEGGVQHSTALIEVRRAADRRSPSTG
jgi:phenylacetaldehyde dehydrogenase